MKPMEFYRLSNIEELDTTMLETLVKRFRKLEQPRIKKLQDYYKGETDILKRTFRDPSKPNHKIVNSFSSQIVDTETGYFMGKPISYNAKNDELMEELQFIFDRNHEKAHNTQLSLDSSTVGVAYELLYLNENGHVRFTHLDPFTTFCIYDSSVEDNILAGVRLIEPESYIRDRKANSFIQVYTRDRITTYSVGAYNKLTVYEEEFHPFNSVPIIPYLNNEAAQGSFEKVKTLIDAYDLAVSDTSNDISYFSDSYLVIKGLEIENEQELETMKQNKVIQFTDPEGEIEWLTKSDSNISVEEYKNRLRKDIVLFSGVPDLQSESFGANLSGIAIQTKMQPLEQKVAIKENFFSEGLDRRLRMLVNFLNMTRTEPYEHTEVQYKFTRNLPTNLMEMGQAALNLKGILPDTTIFELLGISNPAREVEKLQEQYKDSMSDYQSYEAKLTPEMVEEPHEG